MKTLQEDLKIFLTLIFVSLLLFLFDNLGLLKFPKSFLQIFTTPVQFGIYQTGQTVRKQYKFIGMSRFAALENKALKVQLGEVLVENAGLKTQLKEAESINESFSKLSPKTYDLLPARLIGSDRYMIIDKGSLDGVSVGQAVVFRDTYIGQIKEVSPKTSQVLLVTDPDSKIAVFSQNSSGRAKGILQGQFGSKLLMDKILHQEIVETGDLVYSEGTEGRLPRGLIMGKIVEVLERQNEIFKQAKIEPVFNIIDLDLVFVIKSS